MEEYIPRLVRAGLDNDSRTIRALSTKIIKNIKSEDPKIANEISEALTFHGAGLSTSRSIGYSSPPQDVESRFDLLDVQEPINIEKPIFEKSVDEKINLIIDERKQINKLISAGLSPTSSILLYGDPGVGKTLLAKYLSSVFQLKFASLDMAGAVSSYLGKTGQNLKKVITYAKEEPTLLLLDEFDAIAKRRDDSSDLGELKRVVNVLLKELEEWPSHSILVAATNHPELLDKAIWRRFDISLDIPLPDEHARGQIFDEAFKDELYYKKVKKLNLVCAELTEGMSPAEIFKICDRVKKQVLMYERDVNKTLIIEIANSSNFKDIEFNTKFCKVARDEIGMTYREMSTILDKSVSAVQNYIKRGSKE
ncbi:ATP-binding protein [Paraclostridium sp. MRS3W1]|uniref:AAA family ATPase n=1 Tax=Paraclostridium sp. MRS3W1 TaxID=2800798 RepID=UPI0028FD91C2|nr:ATP-binding protein [Paraclostridium sp. MRS3W1]MDU0297450.1 ATP-binding protein [Paraclostridium sp. MRS3W1]